MKDVKFPHPKNVDLFKVKRQLPVSKPQNQNQKSLPKVLSKVLPKVLPKVLSKPSFKSLPPLHKPKPRTFEEIQLERKLAKAGFRGFY